MASRNILQSEAELGEEEELQLALAISQIEAEEDTVKTVNENKKFIDFMAKSIEKKEAELECPVCFEIADVPIFMCQQQHLICASCQPRVTSCPECREPYQKPPRRHRYAERDAEELKKMKDDLAKVKGDSEKGAVTQPDCNAHLPGSQKVKIAVDATAAPDLQKQTEADNIQLAWSERSHTPSEAELKTAAQLAHEGYLSSVKNMKIVNRNSSEISSDNLSKLTSIVTDQVYIDNMTPSTQLGPILASVQSKELVLRNMSLCDENTWALVTAMRTRVQEVRLDYVTLDLELLAAYDGQGKCTELEVWGPDTKIRYETRLKRWARDKKWAVTHDSYVSLVMQRKSETISPVDETISPVSDNQGSCTVM